MKTKWGAKGQEREKIKIFVPFRSNHIRSTKFKKNNKKIQKIQKYHYGFISSQNNLENTEKERKEKLLFRFVPTRHVRKNSKKIAKKNH